MVPPTLLGIEGYTKYVGERNGLWTRGCAKKWLSLKVTIELLKKCPTIFFFLRANLHYSFWILWACDKLSHWHSIFKGSSIPHRQLLGGVDEADAVEMWWRSYYYRMLLSRAKDSLFESTKGWFTWGSNSQVPNIKSQLLSLKKHMLYIH